MKTRCDGLQFLRQGRTNCPEAVGGALFTSYSTAMDLEKKQKLAREESAQLRLGGDQTSCAYVEAKKKAPAISPLQRVAEAPHHCGPQLVRPAVSSPPASQTSAPRPGWFDAWNGIAAPCQPWPEPSFSAAALQPLQRATASGKESSAVGHLHNMSVGQASSPLLTGFIILSW